MPRQFLVYIGVGVLTALVDIGTMQTLLWLSVDHRIAVTFGFLAGLSVNYLCHERFTFKARHTRSTAMLLRYSAVVLMNYLITMACVQLSVLLLNDVLIGKLVSLPLAAVNGFLWGRYWVFR
jgi:putative flippase GtrA